MLDWSWMTLKGLCLINRDQHNISPLA